MRHFFEKFKLRGSLKISLNVSRKKTKIMKLISLLSILLGGVIPLGRVNNHIAAAEEKEGPIKAAYSERIIIEETTISYSIKSQVTNQQMVCITTKKTSRVKQWTNVTRPNSIRISSESLVTMGDSKQPDADDSKDCTYNSVNEIEPLKFYYAFSIKIISEKYRTRLPRYVIDRKWDILNKWMKHLDEHFFKNNRSMILRSVNYRYDANDPFLKSKNHLYA